MSLMLYDPSSDVTVIVYMNVWDVANLTTAELPLLSSAARDARAAVGYEGRIKSIGMRAKVKDKDYPLYCCRRMYRE